MAHQLTEIVGIDHRKQVFLDREAFGYVRTHYPENHNIQHKLFRNTPYDYLIYNAFIYTGRNLVQCSLLVHQSINGC